MNPQAGMLVTEHVRLVRQLGAGGMGSVWQAEHLTLGTDVAVKFIAAPLAADPVILERFRREARAAAQVRSPHVVQIFDLGVSGNGVPYIVMELLEGESLEDRMVRQGRLPLAELSGLVTQVASALDEAHEQNIIHRDIKPSNIFLTSTGGQPFAKVLDFGVAKNTELTTMHGGLTQTQSVIGTPAYMSPEQMLFPKKADRRADVWSLGAVVYEALTGELPFDEPSLPDLCRAICERDFVPIGEVCPELPEQLQTWLDQALAKEPEQRFTTAGQAAEKLAAIVRDEHGATKADPNAKPITISDATGQTNPYAATTPATPGQMALPTRAQNAVERTTGGGLRRTTTELSTEPGHTKRTKKVLLLITFLAAVTVAVSVLVFATTKRKAAKIAHLDISCLGPCIERGSCTRIPEACVATKSRDCRNSLNCWKTGHCSLRDQEGVYSSCIIGKPEDCENSELCRVDGTCSFVEGKCVWDNDEDCRRSTNCKTGESCFFYLRPDGWRTCVEEKPSANSQSGR